MNSLKKLTFFIVIPNIACLLQELAVYETKFQSWLTEFKIVPANDAEFKHFLHNFAENDDFIQIHNNGNSTYTVGHNQFSHMNREEWSEYVGRGALTKEPYSEPPARIHEAPLNLTDLPSEWDWSTQWHRVTSVKDQGSCGSCWSFSTTGALESAHAIRYDDLVSFSEQNILDCDRTDKGCNGGFYTNAFNWAKNNGGICTEGDYPYTSGKSRKTGACVTNCFKVWGATPASYTNVAGNDAALMSALVQQPVSVAIEADQQGFQTYKSGVFTGSCGTRIDHAVLAVGYGRYAGTDFYKIKNSWGYSWGLGGYILLERGKNQKGGQCGILLGPPAYPNLMY